MRSARALAAMLVGFGLWPGAAGAADAVRFAVGFSPDARLGRPTAMRVDLHVDPRVGVVDEVRLLTHRV